MPPPTGNTKIPGTFAAPPPAVAPVGTNTPAASPKAASTPPPAADANFAQPPDQPISERGGASLGNGARLFSGDAPIAGGGPRPVSFDYAAHGLSEPAYRAMLADNGLTEASFDALSLAHRRMYLAGFNGQMLFRAHPRYAAAGSETRLRLIAEFYSKSYLAPEDMSGVRLSNGFMICEGQARAYWQIYGELPPLAAGQELRNWSRGAGYDPSRGTAASRIPIPEGLSHVDPLVRTQPHPRMLAAFERWLAAVKPPRHIGDAARRQFIEACSRAPANTAETMRLTDGTVLPRAQLHALTNAQDFARAETHRFYLAAHTGQRLVEDAALAKVHAAERSARGATYATRSQVSRASAAAVETAIGGESDLRIVRLADGREILAVHERVLRDSHGVRLQRAEAASAAPAQCSTPQGELALVPGWMKSRLPVEQRRFLNAVTSSLETLHRHPSFVNKPFARQMEMQSMLLNDLRVDASLTRSGNLEVGADGRARVRNMEALIDSVARREAASHRQPSPAAAAPGRMSPPPAAGRASGPASDGSPVRLYSAGPEAFLAALYGEHALEPRAGSADHTITIDRKDLKAFEALAEAHGIPRERVPELLAGRAGIEAQKSVARTIEAKLTPEAVAAWLEKPEGQRWLETNRGALADTFRNRWKAGAPGLAMAVVGLLGAREIGEITGIDPVKQPVEHFILAAYAVHGCNEAGRAAGEVLVRRSARLPMDFVKTEVVGAGENAALRMTLSSRTTLGRAFFGALTKNFAGKSAAAIAGNAVTLPLRQLPSMGSAIACSRITDLVLAKTVPGMDPATRGHITDGVLLAPIAYRIAAGTSAGKHVAASLARTRLGARLAQSAVLRSLLGSGALSGVRIAGRVAAKAFAGGFALDMATFSVQLVVEGSDGAAYRRSVNDRMQQRMHAEEDELLADAGLAARAFYGATTSAAKALEFLSPVFSAEVEHRLLSGGGPISINTTGRDFSLEIYAEDLHQTEIVRDDLAGQVLLVMTSGAGDERDAPEFYGALEIGSLAEAIELDDRDEELISDIRALYARMSGEGAKPSDIVAAREKLVAERLPRDEIPSFEQRMRAFELQDSLRTLHFLHIQENDDIRGLADDDGAVTDQAALLELAMPHLTVGQRRDAILDLRKTGLIARILEAERAQDPKLTGLMALAKTVGLTDENGELREDERYDRAVAILLRAHPPST